MDDMIIAVEINFEAYVRNWVIDSGATRHICINKNDFISYIQVKKGEEIIYFHDSRTTKVLRKGEVLLKFTSGKTLALSNVLHIPKIQINLISVRLLGKSGMKVSFEDNEAILTKNNIFVGNGLYNHGLFLLNICSDFSKYAYASAYMTESISLWHARLGHVNVSYLKKMQSLSLISGLDSNNFDKCEICAKAKITKKLCFSVNRETELLSLIHTDLGDLKQTMTRGGKRYYVTFIDNFL